MASLSTLVPINAKCKEGVAGTTTRIDTDRHYNDHDLTPTPASKLPRVVVPQLSIKLKETSLRSFKNPII